MTVDKITSGANTPAETPESGRKTGAQKASRTGRERAASAKGASVAAGASVAKGASVAAGDSVAAGESTRQNVSRAQGDAAKSADRDQDPNPQSGAKTDDKVNISGTARAKKRHLAHTTIKSQADAESVAAKINEAVTTNPDASVTNIHSFEPDILQRFSRVIASVFEMQLEATAP